VSSASVKAVAVQLGVSQQGIGIAVRSFRKVDAVIAVVRVSMSVAAIVDSLHDVGLAAFVDKAQQLCACEASEWECGRLQLCMRVHELCRLEVRW
jgi:hypothetical protein